MVRRDVTPSFVRDTRSLIDSFTPDLLLAEIATIVAMTTVAALTQLPLR